MNSDELANIETIKAYLSALASGAVGDDLAAFFTADAVQIEFPNRLNPSGGQSDRPTLLRRAEQGLRLLSAQIYDVRSMLAHEHEIAVEAQWTGTLAIPLGTLPAGAMLKAHVAMFFELSAGRIHRQRNYDCFEAW